MPSGSKKHNKMGSARWRWRRRPGRRRRDRRILRLILYRRTHRRRVTHIGWHRHTMPLGIHALDVGIVVLALRTARRGACAICPGCAAHQQASTSTNSSTFAVATNGSPSQSANGSTNSGAGYGRLLAGITSCLSTDLIVRVIPAVDIVRTETLERLPGTWQDHHTRPCRHNRTGTQQSNRTDSGPARETCHFRHGYFSGCGNTFCQPSGHSLT